MIRALRVALPIVNQGGGHDRPMFQSKKREDSFLLILDLFRCDLRWYFGKLVGGIFWDVLSIV